MLGNGKLQTSTFHDDHALRPDFCVVFEKNMKALYLLAFLLTANHKDAEQCFVSTLEESSKDQAVFKDWAESWIKRCLIKNAIQIVSAASHNLKRDSWSTDPDQQQIYAPIDAVTRLAPQDRLVFVMSTLERYSDWDCSLLLGCSPSKVAQARMRALRRLPALDEILQSVGSGPAGFLEVIA